ncbi:hypothetical protein BH11ARM1_BH11ARM1_16380 [soil metagenome]
MEGTPARWSSEAYNNMNKQKHSPCGPGWVLPSGYIAKAIPSDSHALLCTATQSAPRVSSYPLQWTGTHASKEPKLSGELMSCPGTVRTGIREDGP